VDAQPGTRPNILVASRALGVPAPTGTTLKQLVEKVEEEVEQLEEKVQELIQDVGIEPAPGGLTQRVEEIALEVGEELVGVHGLIAKVQRLFECTDKGSPELVTPHGGVQPSPGSSISQTSASFEASKYLRLYQQHDASPTLQALQSAVRELLRGWCEMLGLSEKNAALAEAFGDKLIMQSLPPPAAGAVAYSRRPTGRFIVKVWTSLLKLELSDRRPQFFHILQEVVRRGDTVARSLLEAAVILCRGLNANLTSRNIPRDQLVWPGGASAPVEPLRDEGVSGMAFSTEAWTTYRISAMPMDALRFYIDLMVAADKRFRTRQFFASSFHRDVSLGFLEYIDDDSHEAVLFTVRVNPAPPHCLHVGYLEKATACHGEYEHLYPPFSAFTINSVTRPVRDPATRVTRSRTVDDCWKVEITAAVDNLLEPLDLPLAAW
jgi:hypothetical protein